MKILVMTDLEGVAGVVSFTEQGYADGKYHDEAKKLLTAEVNAAVEGMLEMDVNDILIVDGHGPGGVYFNDLHPAAQLMHGRPLAPRDLRNEIFKSYDVTIMIGQHAMAGVAQGNLNHTQNSRVVEYYKLNGTDIGEIAQWALACGALGLPLIFLSGDDAACLEAETLIPNIETAVVKQSLSRSSAISVARQEAHRRIRAGVVQAIKNQQEKPISPLKWDAPFVLEKRFHSTEIADAFDTNPRYKRIDAKTVQLKSDNILDIIYS